MTRLELHTLLTRIYEDGHTLLILLVALPLATLLILIAVDASGAMFWAGIPLVFFSLLMAMRLAVIEVEVRRAEYGLEAKDRRELYQAASLVLLAADVGISMGLWGPGAPDAWIVWVFVVLFGGVGLYRLFR